MDEIGIYTLKQELSAYLRKVMNGKSFVVTKWGKPVALLVPPERLGELEKALPKGEK